MFLHFYQLGLRSFAIGTMITTTVLCGIYSRSHAQPGTFDDNIGKHEISAGYGYYDNNMITHNFAALFGNVTLNGFGFRNTTHYDNKGVWQLNYTYNLSKRFSTGASFLYNRRDLAETKYQPVKTINGVRYLSDGIFTQTYNLNHYTLITDGKFHHINRPNFGLYTGLALGLQYTNGRMIPNKTTAKNHRFAFQVTGIGVRVGKKFGGFAEAGFGDRGFASVGALIRF